MTNYKQQHSLTGTPYTARGGLNPVYNICILCFLYILFFCSPIFVQETGFIISAGTFTLTNYSVLDVSGSIIIQSGANATIDAGSGQIKLTRSWINYRAPSAFVFGTSTVTFYDTITSTITGNTTFYCFVCQTGNKGIYFAGRSTQTVILNLTLNGGAETTKIVLRSTSTATQWCLYLADSSTHTIQYVDVKDSIASNKTAYAYNSTDSSNNINWVFVGANQPPYPPKDLAQFSPSWVPIPWGSWINYQTIRATFTLSDPNATDTLQFNIQFSSYPDFSYLFINSTNPPTATLPNNSATSYINTVLFPEGTWYWRVNCTDNGVPSLSSDYSSGTAVNGRHFSVDLTSPTVPSLVSPLNNSATNQYLLRFDWNTASDTLSGVDTYELRVSTASNFTGIVYSSTTKNIYATLTLSEGRWYWTVRAKDYAGNYSAWQTTWSVVIDTSPPNTVNNFLASKITTEMTTPVQLTWTNVSDQGIVPSGVAKYKIYRSTDNLTYSFIAEDTDGTPYTDNTSVFNTLYYYKITAVDNAGNESAFSNISSTRTARCSIDGYWTDWSTSTVLYSIYSYSASSVIVSGVANQSEFIFVDKSGEQRNDPNGPNTNADFDLRAINICADDTHVYFLVRYRDISASATTYFCISIDTDQISGSGLNIHGDNTYMTIGDKENDTYGAARANHERNIIVHSTSTAATPIIELYASDGTSWYAPPTSPGMDATYLRADFGTDQDGVEIKISRADLGLVGNKTARIILAAYQPNFPLGWANDIDTTHDYADRAALDSIAIIRLSTGSLTGQYYNDQTWSYSAWGEDISDQDLDFWFDVRIAADGTITNNPPQIVTNNLLPSPTNTLTPTLQWGSVSDSDGSGFPTPDAVTSYLVEFDSQSNLSGNLTPTYGYRINRPTNNFLIPNNLADLTTYYWRVWSRDRCGMLSQSANTWTVFIDTGPPSGVTPLSPANGASVNLPVTLDWTDAIEDSGWAVTYQVQVDSDTIFSPAEIDVSVSTSTYQITSLPPGTHYWRARARDAAGNYGPWSATWSFNILVQKIADGDPSDWVGSPITDDYPDRRYQAKVSASEWIWTDALNDNRDSSTHYLPENYDFKELRVSADANWIYFLVKVRDMTNTDLAQFAVAIDTNITSGVGFDWLGDDADTALGGATWAGDAAELPENASQSTFSGYRPFAETIVIFHNTNKPTGTDQTQGDEYWPEYWTGRDLDGDGIYNEWEGVAGSSAVFSPANNIIEARISRSAVGLTGDKRARFCFAIFESSVANRVAWANNQDTTRDDNQSDASDSASIMRPALPTATASEIIDRNEYIFGNSEKSNKWWKDISDQAIDFWVQIPFAADGVISNTLPNTIPDTGRTPANGSTVTGNLTPTFNWNDATDPDPNDAVTSYMIEIGKTTSLDGAVDWRVNLTSSVFTVPSPGLQPGTTYYWRVWSRDRCGTMNASDVWTVFISSITGIANIPPFTPVIDGIKDAGWGTNPTYTSPQACAPVDAGLGDGSTSGIQRQVYVTNDAANLYIGFWTVGDVWGGNKAGAVYGFALETLRNIIGGGADPWRGHEDISWIYKPDFWVNGAIGDGAENFSIVNLYEADQTNPSAWKTPEVLVSLLDYAAKAKTNRWAEFKLPLKKLRLKKDNLAMLFITGIPDATGTNEGQSYSDTIPFDPNATSGYGLRFDTHTITQYFQYRIQYSTVPATHIPNSEPIVGWGKMRSPVSPASTDTVKIMLQITPAEIYGSGFVYYSTDSWTTVHTVPFGSAQYSGDSEYRWATIPKFARGTVVKYYIEVEANGMYTYLYGTDTTSNRTYSRSTAQSNAYSYTVGNAGPSAPTSVTLTPEFPDDFSVLSSTASGATDPDGDSLVYDFEWYRNGVIYSSGRDTTVEFSTSLPAEVTSPGDKWYIRWRSSDTYGALSDWTYSPTRAILGRTWTGIAPDKINTSTISASEFIWRDKTAESTQSNTDLTEARIYTDSSYVWFLFKLRDITSKDLPFVAVTIDTDTVPGSGSTAVGDDTNITLGDEYPAVTGTPGYQARWEKQIVFHSTTTGAFTAEISTSPSGVWSEPSIGYFVSCFPEADIIEARIPRQDLCLVGISTARVTITTFQNSGGRAQDVDTTATNALDSVSIIRISTGSLAGQYYNDPNNTTDANFDELSDNDIDFWTQLRLSASLLTDNSNPPAPTNPSPPNASSTDTLKPTLSWMQSVDSDPGDNVTSWLIELDNALVDGDLSPPYLYQVNVSTNYWTIPENLTGGLTYYWRVSSRDRTGYITPSTIWSFYVSVKEPVIAKIYDSRSTNNLDNFGQVTGIEDADGIVTWDWDPVESGCTYYIDVSSHPEFTPGSFYVQNFSTTSLFYTATGLTRGKYYYARVKAKNLAGVTGSYTVSDGIYINRIQINSDNSDWQPIPTIAVVNSTGLANGIGYWRDGVGSQDTRTDSTIWPHLDLSTFAVTCDEYNLYMYFKFEGTPVSGFDGRHFIQVAVDNDNTSSERVLIGRLVPQEDTYVAGEVPWEYMIRIRSGNDDIYRVDNTWNVASWLPGVYSEHVDNRFFEVMMPLDKLGGKDKFLGKTVNFTVAIASRTETGDIAQYGANNSNMVDVISSTDTWQEVGLDNPRVIDCYLSVSFSGTGLVNSIQLKQAATYYAPTTEPTGAAPPEARGFILYNVFTDVFLDGDPSNNNILDKETAGGDFQGLISTISYFNELGVTHVYLAPVHKFEYGRWGYLADDHFDVSNKFGGLSKFIEFNKIAKRYNLSVAIDWVCGQISEGGRTRKNHPEVWDKTQKVFGGNPLQHRIADARELYANNTIWWLSFGPNAFRVDNPKFWPNDDGNQYFFWQYLRRRWDRFNPKLFTMGEIPGGAGVIAPYCKYGDQLSSGQDFDSGHYGTDIFGETYYWVSGQQTTADFRGDGTAWGLEDVENEYGSKAVASTTLENHDQPRYYNMIADGGPQDGTYAYEVSPYSDYYADPQVPHDGTNNGKFQISYYVNLAHTGASVLFYGSEWGLDGGNFFAWSSGDNAVTKQNMKAGGTTDPMPWGGNTTPQTAGARTSPSIRDSFIRVIQAKAIFDQFKSDPFQGGRSWVDLGTDILGFDRSWGGVNIRVAINRSGTAGTITAPWNCRNWMDDISYLSGASISVPGYYCVILVQNGYYLNTLQGTALPGAIIDVDGKSVWTTKADANGNYSIKRIVSFPGGTTRKVRAWAPGKNIVETTITFPASDGTVVWNPSFTDDTTPPSAPVGLSGRPKDRGVELYWTANPEPDVESYLIYRSSTGPIPDDSWPEPIIEVLNNFYFDNNRDGWDYNGDGNPDWLENGTTLYYRIRAVDRNGNKSSLSNQITIIPGKVKVRFWLDARTQSPVPSVAFVAGNAKALGAQEDGYKWNPIQMISHGDGTFEYTAELPEGMLIEYKYLINDLNTWEFGSGNNRGRHISDPGVYSGYRMTFEIYDQTGNKEMTTVNVWNVYGDEYCDTAPRYPEGLTLIPGDKTLRLGWAKNKEPDVEYYTIYRSTWSPTAGFTQIAKVNYETVSYVDTGLINGNTYYYKMTATDKRNYTSSESSVVSSYPRVVDTTPPSAPTELKAYAQSETSVKIVWKANTEPDIAGYNIYRDGSKLNIGLIPPSFAPKYIDSNITLSTTYYYQVSAVDTAGNESTLSTQLAVHVVPVTFKVDMGDINPSDVEIYGEPEPLDLAGTNRLMPVSGTKFWQVTLPFVSGTQIRYRYAYNNISVKEDDFPQTVDRITTILYSPTTIVNDWEEQPDKPTNPKVYAGVGCAYVYWTGITTAEDLAGYNIYYTTFVGAGEFTQKANPTPVTSSPYTVAGLTNGLTYYFVVRSVDSGEINLESESSALVSCIPEEPIYVQFGCPYTVGGASTSWCDSSKIKLQIAVQSGAGPDAIAVWNTPERANITNGKKDMTSVDGSAWRTTVVLPRGNRYNFIFFAQTTATPPEGLLSNQEYYDTVPNTGTFIVSSSSFSISVPAGVRGYFNPVGPQSDARRVLELPSSLVSGSTLYVFANFASSPTCPTYIQAYGGDRKVTLYWSAPYGEPWSDVVNNVPVGSPGESFKAADVVCGGFYQIYVTTYNPGDFASYKASVTLSGGTFSYTFSGLTNGVTYYYILRASDTFKGSDLGTPNNYSVFSATVSAMPTSQFVVVKIRVNRGANSPWKEVRKTIAMQEGITTSAWDQEGRSNVTPTGRAVNMTTPSDDPTEQEFSAFLTPGTTYNFILFAYSTFPISGLQVGTTYFDTVPASGSGGMFTSTSTLSITGHGKAWCGTIAGTGDARRLIYIPREIASGTTIYVYCNFGSSPSAIVAYADPYYDEETGKSAVQLWWVPYGNWGTSGESVKAVDVIAGGWYYIYRSTVSQWGPWTLWFSTSGTNMYYFDDDRETPGDNLGLAPGKWYYYVIVSSDAYTGSGSTSVVSIVNMYRPGAPYFSSPDASIQIGVGVPTYFKVENNLINNNVGVVAVYIDDKKGRTGQVR